MPDAMMPQHLDIKMRHYLNPDVMVTLTEITRIEKPKCKTTLCRVSGKPRLLSPKTIRYRNLSFSFLKSDERHNRPKSE